MKRLLPLAIALALACPAISTAYARDNERGDKHEQHGNAHAERGHKENRGLERRANKSGRDFGYHRVANGPKFKYKGRAYSVVYAPAFAYPRGYAYRHWTRGAFLPSVFIAEPFFIDYAWIGLPPPPPAHEWVRYGPDALLVNIYNGRVDDVIYDVFY